MPQRTAIQALEARGLACERGGRPVFSGLSFRADAGRLTAVTGPNGSGKSSLLRIAAGLLPPAAGTLRLLGADGEEAPAHLLGHADALKPAFTLRETLRLWAALYRPSNGDARALDGAAEIVGLAHALDLPVGTLSTGQRRRAGLARLLLAHRPLWLLDEPTAALDREGETLLRRLMADHLAGGGLILAATHHRLPILPDLTVDLGGVGP
jgi:heme exporter protein A